MKKETMETLRIEESELVNKIQKANKSGDYGTYKNLIQALERILYLQERFTETDSTKQMWEKSKIVKNGKEINIISIWEQNGDNIENHRTFEVKKEIITNKKNILDITDYVDNYTIPKSNDEIRRLELQISKEIYNKYLNKEIKNDEKVVFKNEIYSVLAIDKDGFKNIVNIIIW